MNKVYSLFLLVSLFVSLSVKAQKCQGKHTDSMVLLTSQNGVEFYYQINHCQYGDEVLLQIINTNSTPKLVSIMEKVSSANQMWQSPTAQSFQIQSQATISYTQQCSPTGSALELISTEMFPNEPKTQILAFELFNININ